MTAHGDAAAPASAFWAWLRSELAARPGRGAAVARMTVNCTVTVIVGMVFQIPLPAYMAYIVFLISREDSVGTLVTAVGGALAATVAVVFTLLLFTIDAAEPGLRLPLMAASTFAGFFLARTSKVAPIAFLVGFVLVVTQTLVDVAPSTEALTRLVLWLWVVCIFPAALTALTDLAMGRQPAGLADETTLRLLDSITAVLRGAGQDDIAQRQAEITALLELREHAQMADHQLRTLAEIDRSIAASLAEILALLPLLPAVLPAAVRKVLVDCSLRCRRAGVSGQTSPSALSDDLLLRLEPSERPIVVAILGALGRLEARLADRHTGRDAQEQSAPSRFFVADAWSNRAHVRFALKATIAVMAAYATYTLLDWPGLRTAVTTCFFVALTSLGETVHKLTLRISGALIGGLLAGLCIVYLLPHMTDIGQLSLLIAAASALSAWVATSSERLSYAGMQIAFAFFLGVLQSYGPATDLTVLRDRVVGVLLGNLWISLVFSVLWPTSAIDRMRASSAQALRALAGLARNTETSAVEGTLVFIRRLVEARHFASIAMFDRRVLRPSARDQAMRSVAVSQLERLGAATFMVAGQSALSASAFLHRQDALLGEWLEEAGQRLDANLALPRAPGAAGEEARSPPSPASVSPTVRAAIEARVLLRTEIEHVAPATT